MAKRKGNIIRGYRPKKRRSCEFGVNKNTGRCLKTKRRRR